MKLYVVVVNNSESDDSEYNKRSRRSMRQTISYRERSSSSESGGEQKINTHLKSKCYDKRRCIVESDSDYVPLDESSDNENKLFPRSLSSNSLCELTINNTDSIQLKDSFGAKKSKRLQSNSEDSNDSVLKQDVSDEKRESIIYTSRVKRLVSDSDSAS